MGCCLGMERDDSLSLNLLFVVTVKGPNASPLMAMLESTKEESGNHLQHMTTSLQATLEEHT